MSLKTYGYINKVNNNMLTSLNLNLIISQDELIVLGLKNNILKYQEGEKKWKECF
jgi:hypothetical protein